MTMVMRRPEPKGARRPVQQERAPRRGDRTVVPDWVHDAVFPEDGEVEDFLDELDRWRHPERH